MGPMNIDFKAYTIIYKNYPFIDRNIISNYEKENIFFFTSLIQTYISMSYICLLT